MVVLCSEDDGVWSMSIAGTILGAAVAKSRCAVTDVSEVGIWCVVIVGMGGIDKLGRCVMGRQSPGDEVTSRLSGLWEKKKQKKIAVSMVRGPQHQKHLFYSNFSTTR